MGLGSLLGTGSVVDAAWIRRLPADATRNMGQVLDAQPTFRVVDWGNSLEPMTPGARTLMDSPAATGYQQVLKGVAQLNRGAHQPDLDTIALSVDDAGFGANAVRSIADGMPPAVKFAAKFENPLSRQFVEQTMGDTVESAKHAYAMYALGGMILSPGATRTFHAHAAALAGTGAPLNQKQLAQLTDLAYAIAHELEHSRTPPGVAFSMKSQGNTFVEEATADVMSLWPGTVRDAARTLKHPQADSIPDVYVSKELGYPRQRYPMRLLVEMAGIDVTKIENRAAAAELLQSRHPKHVANEIAGRVIANMGKGAGDMVDSRQLSQWISDGSSITEALHHYYGDDPRFAQMATRAQSLEGVPTPWPVSGQPHSWTAAPDIEGALNLDREMPELASGIAS